MKLLIGVGTSLGVCFMARESEEDNFSVFPSETCMVRMPTFNKFDREFVEFLKKDKNIERNDVCVFLSGKGLPFLVEFLVKKMNI
jgi:glucokinase